MITRQYLGRGFLPNSLTALDEQVNNSGLFRRGDRIGRRALYSLRFNKDCYRLANSRSGNSDAAICAHGNGNWLHFANSSHLTVSYWQSAKVHTGGIAIVPITTDEAISRHNINREPDLTEKGSDTLSRRAMTFATSVRG